ncbi:MAG: TlpA family protein disulfide reductase [Phycisphaerales bacterium]|nr:MAG: TlpA family protein disulfide reductase [Phycisphaerales bacterium]
MGKLVAGIAAIVVVLGGIYLFKPGVSVGSTSPDLTLTDAYGTGVRLADYRGQVVVLDFWASWCPPCIAAMPAMDRLHRRYAHEGVVIFGVNVNDNRDPAQTMAELGVSYPLIVRGEAAAKQFGVRGIPTIVVIGRDGKIKHQSSGWGPGSEGEIERVIKGEL